MLTLKHFSAYNGFNASIHPIDLRETCLLLMQTSPTLASQLQQEINQKNTDDLLLIDEKLSVTLHIETIGSVISELTRLGEQALNTPSNAITSQKIIKELIDCWSQLAEELLVDVEINDSLLH
jgi:hypothetical protein